MSQALVNYSVPDMERMALAFAGSKLFGIATPDQALALCLIAQAEGRHPASAAQDYHIIQGKPSKKSDAMLRDFLANSGKVTEWELADDRVAATFSHPAGGSVRIDWDMARAKKAGITNPMWSKYPRQMLRARVVSEGVRTVFPMATSGMYVPEEVSEFEPKPAESVTIDGEIIEPVQIKSSAQAKRDGDWEALKAEIDAQPTLAQLEILVAGRQFQAMAKALPKAWVTELQNYVQGARDGFAQAEPPAGYVEPNFDPEPDHEPA